MYSDHVGTMLDASGCGVLALCSECPGWREMRSTRAAANQARADHELRVHATWWGAGSQACRQQVRRLEAKARTS